MKLHVLLVCFLPVLIKATTDIFVQNDLINKISGEEGELVAEIEVDRDEDVDYCMWESPTRKRYYSDDKDEVNGVRVRLKRQRRGEYECILMFRRLQREDGGPWECLAKNSESRRLSKGRFGFVEVYDNKDFSILLQPDQKQLIAPFGRSIKLICPSTNKNNPGQKRPQCRWFAPNKDKAYDVIDRYYIPTV